MTSPAALVALLALAMPAPAVAAADHVVVTGGVTIPRGEVAGDVFVIDGPVRIDGRVTGDVVSVAGPVTVGGRIDGSLTAVADRASLAAGASVGGDLLYGDERPVIHAGADVAGKVSDEHWAGLAAPAAMTALSVTWWIAVSTSTLLLGLALLWAAPRLAEQTWRTARTAPGPTVAWGAGLFAGLPIVASAALFTLIGLPLGVAALLALVPLGAVGYVTSAWLLGRRVARTSEAVVAFLAGWAILRGAALIPGIGLAVAIAATAFGLGAIAVTLYGLRPPKGVHRPPLPAS